MAGLADGFVRMAFRMGMVCALALSAMPMTSTSAYAQTQPTTRLMNGIEVSGRFLEVWSKQDNERDSLYVNGLPITPRRSEISLEDGRAYDTQWFERARYEAHPENKLPNDVLLGRLGASRVEGRGKIDIATGKVADPADVAFVGIEQPGDLSASKLWFPETRHTLSGKLLDAWKRYGGLQQFGFPLSEPLQEVSQADGKPYTVQYFERNRMELHPEKPAPYDVELGLLGVEQVGARAVPAEELPVAPPKDVKSSKDEIKIAMSQEPADLTMFHDDLPTRRVLSLIEDKLVGHDEVDNLFPLDAWYVPTLENGGSYFVGSGDDRHLTVKYKIRRGIKWSDGVELTSNDAIFAYRLIMNPYAQEVNRIEYEKLQNIDNPDKYTVIYNYRSSKQAAAFLNGLLLSDRANYSFLQFFVDQKKPVVSRLYSEIGLIYPEHVLGKVNPAKLWESPLAFAPIGTGPYKVQKWVRGQEMVLVPNEHYTLTSKPLIGQITLKFIQGVDKIMVQVYAGEIDLVTSEAFTTLPPLSNELYAMGMRPAIRYAAMMEHLDFNFAYAPFKDRAVREAIIRAINRHRIFSLDSLTRPPEFTPRGPLPSTVHYSLDNYNFNKNYPDIVAKYKLPTYPFDATHAKQLLEGAGWKIGPDGIRQKDGERLSFIYGAFPNSLRPKIQERVVTDLKDVGIEAIPRLYPRGIFGDLEPFTNGTVKLREYTSTITPYREFSTWLCSEAYSPKTNSGQNLGGYCNPALDAANARLNTSVGVEALEAVAEAQVILMQDIATVPLARRPNIELVTLSLANYKLTDNTTSSFWNARQWYFK